MKPLSRLSLTFILACTLVGLLGMRPVSAATIVVDTVVDESDGDCYDGDCSLRDAVDLPPRAIPSSSTPA
ncbi:MAG: hypothetical protein Kow0047_06590 [Anaerolineae bacterium]